MSSGKEAEFDEKNRLKEEDTYVLEGLSNKKQLDQIVPKKVAVEVREEKK